MGYVDNNLMIDETIIYRARLHWIIFIKSGLCLAASLFAFFYLSSPYSHYLGYALLAVFAYLFPPPLVDCYCSEFVVSNKRLIVKTGLIKINSLEIFLNKVEGIQVNQSILGRILGFGSITIIGTGGTKDPLLNIKSPLEFRKFAQEEIAALNNYRQT